MTSSTGIRKWLAFGTGAGIEVGAGDLRATLVRVRPSGVGILGSATISGFRDRPAAEWGREYADFLKRHGAGHLAAAVLLPREEVVVRQLSLPGLSDKDVAAAIGFQVDSLHPYPEDTAAWAWARTGSAGAILVGITRREVLERYISLLAEAGIKVSSFTFSGAALYGAMRLLAAPRCAFVTRIDFEGATEIYGESAAKPMFSALFDLPPDKALALASAELRLEAETEPAPPDELLPRPKPAPAGYDFSRNALGYAAALAGACPRLALPFNLLPPEHRTSTSRLRLVPTAVLVLLLVAALSALAAIRPIEDRRYVEALRRETAALEPQAARAADLDRRIERARQRARLLDDFRRRGKADLDVLAEVTRILQPPAWLQSLELDRDLATLSGMAEQAGGLLRLLDDSPLFQASEFTVPLARSGRTELFRIRAEREGGVQ